MANWIEIARADEIAEGASKECIADGTIIALFRVSNDYYAVDGICPHHGGPLGKGTLDGCVVKCPWHGWQFDVTDGRYQSNDDLHQKTFEVRIVDGKVLVNIEQSSDNPDCG